MLLRIVVQSLLITGLVVPVAAQETYPCGLPNALQYGVQATGRNSGHLLTLMVFNPSEQSATIPATEVLIPGENGTQAMICRIPATPVPAGKLQNIILRGESIAFRRPALKLGARPAAIESWIPATADDILLQPGMPLPAEMEPVDTALYKQYLRFPGADMPIGFFAPLESHLTTAAPVLFALHTRVKDAYDTAWDAGRIQLPFARDQVYQIGLQQTVWYIFSILENKPYTKAELLQSLIEQTERDLVQPFAAMPAATKAYIQQSTEQIWTMIRMVALGSGLVD